MQRALISACTTGGRTMNQLAVYLKNLGRDGVEQLTKPEFNAAIKWALNSAPTSDDLSQELKPAVKAERTRRRNTAVVNHDGELEEVHQ